MRTIAHQRHIGHYKTSLLVIATNCVTGMAAALKMEPVHVIMVIMATHVNCWNTVTLVNFMKPLTVINAIREFIN